MSIDVNSDITLLLPLVGTTQAVLKRLEKGTGSLTFIRATTATRLNPDTNLIEAVASGDLREDGRQYLNRLYYSEDFSQSNWAKSNVTVGSDNATAPNGKAVAQAITASVANGTCLQAVVDISAARYGSIYLKRKTGSGNIQVTLDGGSTWTTVAVTGEWVRLGAGQTLANPSFGIRIVTSGDAVYAWGAQLEDATAATRYKKSGSSPAYAPLGALIEGQRTNLTTYSEQLDNGAWNKSAWPVTITSNSAVAPDGTQTADTITGTASATYHAPYTTPACSAGVTYTISAFLKKVNQRYVNLGDQGDVSGHMICFDFDTAAIVGVQNVLRYSAAAHGNGWYRVSVTFIRTNGGTLYLTIGCAQSPAIYEWFDASGVSYYAWGAQAEAGTFPSSYIPTTSAAVTRNADELTVPASGNISDTLGTVFAEFDSIHNTSSNDGVIGSASGNSRPLQSLNNTTMACFDGTSSLQITTASFLNSLIKASAKWSGSSMAIISGAVSNVGAFDGSMGVGVSIQIGGFSGAYEKWGHIKHLILFNRALTDAEMVALTT